MGEEAILSPDVKDDSLGLPEENISNCSNCAASELSVTLVFEQLDPVESCDGEEDMSGNNVKGPTGKGIEIPVTGEILHRMVFNVPPLAITAVDPEGIFCRFDRKGGQDFGYARQDRKVQPRVPITAKLVANSLRLYTKL